MQEFVTFFECCPHSCEIKRVDVSDIKFTLSSSCNIGHWTETVWLSINCAIVFIFIFYGTSNDKITPIDWYWWVCLDNNFVPKDLMGTYGTYLY